MPEWASTPAPASPAAERPRFAAPRWAATLVLTTLFFAGASLSAVAGDQATQLFDSDAAVAAAESEPLPETSEPATAAPEEAPVEDEVALEPELPEAVADVSAVADAPASEPASAPEPAAVAEAAPAPEPAAAVEPAAAPAAAAEEPEPEPAHGTAPSAAIDSEPGAAPASAPAAVRAVSRVSPAVQRPQPVAKPAPQVTALDPEAHADGVSATVWLHRQLPDPTPPSLRLSPAVASRLLAESRRAGAEWELVLGVLRADGSRRALPARGRSFADVAASVAGASFEHDGWTRVLKATGRTAAADRALALARYYRAVGIEALVDGLLGREDALGKQIVDDRRISLYAGGRADVEAGRVDVRVLALLAYLAESYGQVTVSSLVSGHGLYSRPGVVSAHVYGQAVDIAALGGMAIAGNQEPGGLTERAVRDILLLPAEVLPRQLISLLGLGGPSFPLADHGDHIHVGY